MAGFPMKVCLISFSKSANLGDLLIASELVAMVGPDVELSTLSYSDAPQGQSDLHAYSDGFVPIRQSTLRMWTRRWIHRLGGSALLRLVRGRRPAGPSPWNQGAVGETLASADLVIIGGGNMVFDTVPWSQSWKKFADAIQVPLANGTPILAVNLGIGPFATDWQESKAAEVLSLCDHVSFRDQASLDLYRKHVPNEGELVVDPVFGWKTTVIAPPAAGAAIGVNCVDLRLTDAGRLKVARAARSYERLVRELLEKVPNEVVLFSTDLNDYSLLEELQRRVDSPRCRVQVLTGVEDLIALYGDLGVVVGSRMHVLITAFTQRVPTVSITWQAKVSEYRRIVGEQDSEILLSELGDVTEIVVERVREKLLRADSEREQIEARLGLIRRRLAEGTDGVRQIIGAIRNGS